LLDVTVINAERQLAITAAGDIIATDGDTIKVNEGCCPVSLSAGGNILVSGSTVNGGRQIIMTAGGDIVADGANLVNNDSNAGSMEMTANGGRINMDNAQVNIGRTLRITAVENIQASGTDMRAEGGSGNITLSSPNLMVGQSTITANRRILLTAEPGNKTGRIGASEVTIIIIDSGSGTAVELFADDDIDFITGSITIPGNRGIIRLHADDAIDCTGSTFEANSVIVDAGGAATSCP
jgi:hypothetical protein